MLYYTVIIAMIMATSLYITSIPIEPLYTDDNVNVPRHEIATMLRRNNTTDQWQDQRVKTIRR
jgi:hypothetical protein